jgi:hypothetical protein
MRESWPTRWTMRANRMPDHSTCVNCSHPLTTWRVVPNHGDYTCGCERRRWRAKCPRCYLVRDIPIPRCPRCARLTMPGECGRDDD